MKINHDGRNILFRTVLPLFCTLILLIFSACNKLPPADTSDTPEIVEEVEPSPPPVTIDKNKIGVSFPDMNIDRWNKDGFFLKEKLEGAGFTVDLQYAENNVENQVSQVKQLIQDGSSVLVIAPIAGDSLTEALERAKEENITVISYDILIMNSDAVTYFATFDNFMVGELQGQYLKDKFTLENGSGPYDIEIFAGSQDDCNSQLYYGGAMSVLQPYIDNGQIVIASGESSFDAVAIPNGSASVAQARAKKLINANFAGARVLNGMLAPDDSIANGITNALFETHFTKDIFPVITGQGCTIESVKNIRDGYQTMSVFKDPRLLAGKVSEMISLMKDEKPIDINDTKTFDNGTGIIPTYKCKPVAVTAKNYYYYLIDGDYYTTYDLK